MAHSASRPRGFWKQITSRPRIAATRMPRTSMLVHSWKFPAPKACAVSPLVPMRTKPAVPVDEVEDGYADGECPDRRCGVVQVSCDGGTHDTHKGTVMLEMMFGTANRRISRFICTVFRQGKDSEKWWVSVSLCFLLVNLTGQYPKVSVVFRKKCHYLCLTSKSCAPVQTYGKCFHFVLNRKSDSFH